MNEEIEDIAQEKDWQIGYQEGRGNDVVWYENLYYTELEALRLANQANTEGVSWYPGSLVRHTTVARKRSE